MNSTELLTLAHLLQAIALGSTWETTWTNRQTDDNPQGWGPPLGRDVEYCIANRIPMRLVPADLGEPEGVRMLHNPECPRAYALFMRRQGSTIYDMYCMACRLETELGQAVKNLDAVTGVLNDLTAKQYGYAIALDYSAGNVDAGADDVISAARAIAAERYRPGSDWECLNGKIGELCDALERYYGRLMEELGNATDPRVEDQDDSLKARILRVTAGYHRPMSDAQWEKLSRERLNIPQRVDTPANSRPPVPAFPQPLAELNGKGEA